MGKKARQESLKTSNKEKKQLHNLIKVLRPKVYITDSLSFKSLVQDLTGNGSTSTILSPPIPFISSPKHQNDAIFAFQSYLQQESSRDVSFDASNASIESSDHQASNTEEEASPWHYESSIYNDITSNSLLMNEETGLSRCEDLESLLVNIDQYSWCSNYGEMLNDEQLGGWDYDLGMLY